MLFCFVYSGLCFTSIAQHTHFVFSSGAQGWLFICVSTYVGTSATIKPNKMVLIFVTHLATICDSQTNKQNKLFFIVFGQPTNKTTRYLFLLLVIICTHTHFVIVIA